MSVPVATSEPGGATGAPEPGAYRIHAVAEMTGVPEPTLRAWERRYGIPAPERTATGYRIYSLHEVEQVRAMVAACAGGMSAAEAARWVRSQRRSPTAEAQPARAKDILERLRDEILGAVVGFDDERFDAALRQVLTVGPATTIADAVISPVMRELGTRWHDGELSIAQEHYASQRLGKVLRDLVHLAAGSPTGARVLLASFADDEHELGLFGFALRLGAWGFRPTVLGARTPPGALRTAVDTIGPALVGLSVTVSPERARARELVEDYARACGKVRWMVGGAGVAPIADLVRSHGGLVDPGSPALLEEMVRKATSPRGAR